MSSSLPSKLVSETITVEFDFTGLLDWGETLVTATTSVEVISGNDTNPSEMISGSETIGATTVLQDITLGLPGVIYILVMTGTDTAGATYQVVRRLAVLSDDNSFNPGGSLSLSGVLPDGIANIPYSESLQINGGYLPYEFDDIISGTPPPWMAFNIVGDELVCSGTPTDVPTVQYTFTPQIRDGVNNLASCPVDPTFTHIQIAGDVPDGAIEGSSSGTYSQVDGELPVTYAVTSGTFPAGLTLATDGSWSGTFTTSAIYNWEVTGTDAVGNTSTISDTCNVAAVEWWLTLADPVGVGYRNIWISQDALTFAAPITPVPLAPNGGWGAVDVDINRAFVIHGSNNYADFSDVANPNTCVLTSPPDSAFGHRYFFIVDGIMFWLTHEASATVSYYYSLDLGDNWTPVLIEPGQKSINCITKVGSAWVSVIAPSAGGNPGFYRSIQSVPTSWTFIRSAAPTAGFGGAGGWFQTSGTNAVIFNNTGWCFRTNNGLTYDEINTGITSGDNRDCVYYNGVFVGGVDQNGTVVRSDDQGSSWTQITLGGGGTVLKRIDAADGRIVATMSDGPWVSTDLGLTWTKSTSPLGGSSNQWCGHVRRAATS